jgi:hypothetical protein
VHLGFAVADFDQDGRLDAGLPTGTQEAMARVYFGDGRGAFGQDPLILGSDSFAYTHQAATADLNSDGLPDLLLVKEGTLWAFLGDGAGNFAPSLPAHGLPGFGVVVATGDFNGDDRVDVVTPIVTAAGVVKLYLGNGDGTFGAPSSISVGGFPNRLVVANFDAGATLDVAVVNQGDATISILLGDGAGHLSPTGTIPFEGIALAIAAGNFDLDSDTDLAVGGDGATTEGFFATFIGNGTGGFVPGTSFSTDGDVTAIVAADLTGDDDPDLLVGSTGFDGLTVYSGQDGAGFGPYVSYDFPGLHPAMGDFDADGDLDVALAGRGLMVLRNDGDGGLVVPPSSPTLYASDARLVNLNGDVFPDLVVASPQPGPGGVAVLIGDGHGRFVSFNRTDITLFPHALTAGEFTSDGNQDVALSNTSQIIFLPGDGAGILGPAIYFDLSVTPSATDSGDLDDDGNRDIVAFGSATQILFGDGAGGFSEPSSVEIGGSYGRLGDVDGMNGPDLVVSNGAGISVALNDGSGSFGPAATYPAVVGRFVLDDFDEDESIDLVGAAPGELVLLRGDGSGGFLEGESILPENAFFVETADFNGDGHADLAFDGNTSMRVAVGDGTGAFALPTNWATSVGSIPSIAVGDIDADGRPDLLAVDRDAVSLLNTNCDVRRIGIDTQPATCATPGQPFPQQPALGVYDDGGNVITCDTGVVLASIVPGTGDPSALLAGDTDVAAVLGVATFTDLSIANAAAGYLLEFVHPVAGKTRSRALTVGDPPPPPKASNSGTFCQGQDVSLFATAVPGAVYRWTGPDGFTSTIQSPVIHEATLAAAGTYTVVAIVDGCQSSGATTTVDALPTSPGPTILGENQVCPNEMLVLHADDGAVRHSWYRNGEVIEGVTGPVLVLQADANTPGDYQVSSSDATGCTTDLSAPITVELAFPCVAAPRALSVDPASNGVLEPGETAVIAPSWRNLGLTDLTLTGTLGTFTGLAGASYAIQDGTGDYGVIAPNWQVSCLNTTVDCYAVTVAAKSARPATHWDAFLDEEPQSGGPTKTWILHVGESFADVPASHSFYAFVETILHNGITAGCTSTSYCPSNGVTRAQMAVFLLKAKHGASYVPPTPSSQAFADVPLSSLFAPWITELAAQGITAGCGNGNYCPTAVVNRAQMAVFLLKTAQIVAPPCTGVFEDVPCPGGFGVDYIEKLYDLEVTQGCNPAPLLYCPNNPNTRGQMAVFLTRTFPLRIYGP